MRLPIIRVVPEDVTIWLVYAGVRRRHLETFQRSRSVFLELPAFGADEETFDSDEEIGRHLEMSAKWRRWLLEQRGAPPSRRARDYRLRAHPAGTAEARGQNAELGNIERMFREMKRGDLVLCPPIGHYNPFLIGEVTSNWQPEQKLELEFFGNEEVPVRKVRWLSERISRRDFPAHVARYLQNQHAISKVDQNFTEDILRLAYRSFSWNGKSKLEVFGENYHGNDPTQLNDSAQLIKYCVAAVAAHQRGEMAQFQNLTIRRAINSYYDPGEIEHFTVNFNSPGHFETVLSWVSGSALLAALLKITTSSPAQNLDAVKNEAVNDVRAALRGDDGRLTEEVQRLVASLRDDRIDEVRRDLGAPAAEDLGLRLDRDREVDNP